MSMVGAEPSLMSLPIDMSEESAVPHQQIVNVVMRSTRGLYPTALYDRFCLRFLRYSHKII